MICLMRVGALENTVLHDFSYNASVLPTTYASSAGSVVGSAIFWLVYTCERCTLDNLYHSGVPLLREEDPDLVMNTLLSVSPILPTVL